MSETPYDRIRAQLRALPANSDDWNERMNEQRKQERMRRAAMIAELPPVGQRPKCRQCSHELEVYFHWSGGDDTHCFGYEGNNNFCTLRCGFRWAVAGLKANKIF